MLLRLCFILNLIIFHNINTTILDTSQHKKISYLSIENRVWNKISEGIVEEIGRLAGTWYYYKVYTDPSPYITPPSSRVFPSTDTRNTRPVQRRYMKISPCSTWSTRKSYGSNTRTFLYFISDNELFTRRCFNAIFDCIVYIFSVENSCRKLNS